MESRPRPPLGDVLGTGALAGLIGGLAAGAIDAVWSWRAATQFLPSIAGRLRLVLYTALSLGAAGVVVGVMLAALALVLSRGSRLGDLWRFGWRDHAARRKRDPGDAVAGLALVGVGLPVLAIALSIAYKLLGPYVATRTVKGLVIVVIMSAVFAALVATVVVAFPLARAAELGLRPAARKLAVIASPWAPLVALGVMAVGGAAVYADLTWNTTRLLPLRAPIVVVVAAALACGALGPARRAAELLRILRPALRWGIRVAVVLALPLLVLGAGGSEPVIKAASAYTGLGAPIARSLRRLFDADHDGYSRYLGGGDCNDSDPTVHPGAPEIPDDGIDQNCVGGDADTKAAKVDPAFATVPDGVPKDFDIVVITIDTTRADHLGMYGYKRPTSPNLDKLATEGTVFDAGWAHAPSTRYSMPAILTGRLPLDVYYDTGIDGWPGIAAKATTLGEALGPLGFSTGAITNYWYFGKERHMDQGFTEYDNENANKHGGVAGAGPERTRGSSSKEQTDKAIAFVDRHANDRFMLWVHYYDPHADYEPHADGPAFGTGAIDLYDGELRFTDLHIGRLLDELRAKGVYDKTVVVVTGDHGEGFGEHGVAMHGYHLYAAQTKVPLVIRVPGLAPRHTRTPAGHVDIMPTLVNLAGGEPNADMMGRSLVDVLAGKDVERTVFQQLSFEGNHEMRGGVDARCHVIYNVSPETGWEVYRVDTDPGERRDVSDSGECSTVRRAVARWYDLEQVPHGAAEALLPARPPIDKPLDVDLGDSVRLLAVDAPPTAKPGEPITLQWTFEARGRVTAGWRMFVHVEGPGHAFTNGDHKPARPFEWWRRGQFIRYTTTVTLPKTVPTGKYTVWAGLFLGGKRAPARSPHARIENDAVAAATIEVAP